VKTLPILLFLPELFPNIFVIKNRNNKNVDLLYIKIYKSSVVIFGYVVC
jgi:hypothetical protein